MYLPGSSNTAGSTTTGTARASQIERAVDRPQSKLVPSPTPRRPDRVIDYPMIDAGRLEKAASSPSRPAFGHSSSAISGSWTGSLTLSASRPPAKSAACAGASRRSCGVPAIDDTPKPPLTRAWTNQRLTPEIASLKPCQDAQCAELQRHQNRLTARFDPISEHRLVRAPMSPRSAARMSGGFQVVITPLKDLSRRLT